MITVTDRAASALETLLTSSQAQPGQGVKLVPISQDSISMVIDSPAEGDEIVRRDSGSPLLIIDKEISGHLDGTMIDCDEDNVNG
ncbi:MAG: hypothetical protein AB7K36_30565, partial [Chloroflexota bacterium]